MPHTGAVHFFPLATIETTAQNEDREEKFESYSGSRLVDSTNLTQQAITSPTLNPVNKGNGSNCAICIGYYVARGGRKA